MLERISTVDPNPEREEIEQVRKLLFGDIQRENDRRLAAIEMQLRELRQTMERQFSEMAANNAASQAHFIRTLGATISELGNQISRLADGPPADALHHD
jgi:hypothetical protein